jgi:AcrR family transcriptional regulator
MAAREADTRAPQTESRPPQTDSRAPRTDSRAPQTRRSRADGRRSRERILLAAAELATVEGIDGLSLARLAGHLGMSKSGLFAHFGSKEELQLAAIDTAEAVFAEDVLAPAMAEPDGLPRLEALCERFLSHVGRRVFPGGCFFASVGAELDTRPGPVRERVAGVSRTWMGLLAQSAAEAQRRGELDPGIEPAQLAFELNSLLLLGNAVFLLDGPDAGLERARRGVADRLRRARPS